MLPTIDRQRQVQALEEHLKGMPQADLKNFHHFDFGVYTRGGVIPAETVVTGAIHLQTSTFVLAKGTMVFLTDDGPVEVTAPWSCVSPPGVKRVAYTLTDCVCLDIAETDCTTPEQAERELVVASYDQLTTNQRKILEGSCPTSLQARA